MKTWLVACVAAALGSAGSAWGEPLERRQVSADANWLVHIDFDMLATSRAAQKIRDDWLMSEPIRRSFQQVSEVFGLNPAQPQQHHLLWQRPFGVL